MALQVVWTQSALSDLEQIVCYVAADDLEAARRFGTSLIQRVEQVASFPRSGRVVPEVNEDTVREIILTPYRIVYEIFNDTQSLHVLRVWHAARGPVETSK
jgi:toxin ParE1/3/4